MTRDQTHEADNQQQQKDDGHPPLIAQDSSNLVLASSSDTPSSDYTAAIDGAMHDTLRVLQQVKRRNTLHDKALIVYRWGRTENNQKVLRPQTIKLYESLTGRLLDIRRSSDDMGQSFGSNAYLGFASLDSGTFLSPYIQTLIINNVRNAGYSCRFVEVSVDQRGLLQWRNPQGRRLPQGNSTGSVRCLMVNVEMQNL